MKFKLITFLVGSIVIMGTLVTQTEYFAYQIKAQQGFQVRPPFNGNYEIGSYVDHNKIRVKDTYFVHYNGQTYKNENPYFYDNHSGIDWPLLMSTMVQAAAVGTVTVKRLDPPPSTYGYMIILDHGDYSTLYAHLLPFTISNAISLTVGSTVVAGQAIAISGNTKGITETWDPHLHFEVLYSGNRQYTDPFGWRGAKNTDPLAYNGQDSICLWENEWCSETIVEDGDVPITGTARFEQ